MRAIVCNELVVCRYCIIAFAQAAQNRAQRLSFSTEVPRLPALLRSMVAKWQLGFHSSLAFTADL